MLTHIGDGARAWISTPQHLLDDRLHLRLLVAGIALLESLPVIAEDLLKGRFVDPLSVVCHGRWLSHTLPSGSTFFASLAVSLQVHWREEKKAIKKGNSYTIKMYSYIRVSMFGGRI